MEMVLVKDFFFFFGQIKANLGLGRDFIHNREKGLISENCRFLKSNNYNNKNLFFY